MHAYMLGRSPLRILLAHEPLQTLPGLESCSIARARFQSLAGIRCGLVAPSIPLRFIACLMAVVLVISLDAPACSNTDVLGGSVKRVKPTRAAVGNPTRLALAVETPGGWAEVVVSHPSAVRKLPRTALY